MREVIAEVSSIGREVGREISREVEREFARESWQQRGADRNEGRNQDREFRVEQIDKQTNKIALGANGSLELKNISGDIIVTAGNGREVTMDITRRSRGRTDADAKLGLEQVKVEVDHRGDRANVETRYPEQQGRQRLPYSVSVAYVISAPAGTRMNITNISGDVTVKGMTGDLSLDVVSGDIQITNSTRVMNVKSISGDTLLADVQNDAVLTVGSVSGDLTLQRVKVRRLAVNVISGDVVATDVTADGVELRSMSGSVSILGPAHPQRPVRSPGPQRRRPSRDYGECRVRSARGDVFGTDSVRRGHRSQERHEHAAVLAWHGGRRQRGRRRDDLQRKRHRLAPLDRFPDRCSAFRRPPARRLPQGSVIGPASRRSQRSGSGTRYTDPENATSATRDELRIENLELGTWKLELTEPGGCSRTGFFSSEFRVPSSKFLYVADAGRCIR